MKERLGEFISNEIIEKGESILWRTRIRVSAVIFDEAQRVLLVRQVEDLWVLPGGGVEQGETILAGLRRELKEETGLDIEPIRLLWFSDEVSEEYKTHYINVTFWAKPIGGSIGKGEAVHEYNPLTPFGKGEARSHDCRYCSCDELAQMNVFPKSLKDELWQAVEASKSYDAAQLSERL